MINNQKSFYISSNQLFFILFTVRLYSLLLNTDSGTDYFLYFTISLLLCIIAEYVKKYVYKNRLIQILIGIIAFILMVQTILSYVLFTNDAVHPDFSSLLLLVMIALAVLYSSTLGIEAVARFSPFCGITLVIALNTVFLTELSAFHFNYINALDFELNSDLYTYVKCLDLPVIYVVLEPYVKGNARNSLLYSVAASYGLEGLVTVFVFCVTGTAERVYEYPAFILFCLSHIGNISRLDIVFTASVLLALFLKCSVLLSLCRIIIRGDNYKKTDCNY